MHIDVYTYLGLRLPRMVPTEGLHISTYNTRAHVRILHTSRNTRAHVRIHVDIYMCVQAEGMPSISKTTCSYDAGPELINVCCNRPQDKAC